MVLSEALHESDTLRIEYYYRPERQNKRLAFVFSSLGSKILNQNINGGDYLIENGFDVVNFNSSRNDWFQSVPKEVFAVITEINSVQNYEQRVAMGSSMGGYAAIAFSKYLRCDIALAYSPQHNITIQSDPRFAGHIENIEWIYPLSAGSIANGCKFFIVYDNKDLYDKLHAETLKSIIPAESYSEILLPYAGHAVVFYLLEVGLLKQVSLNVLTGKPIEASKLRENRRQSRQYLSIAAEHLRQKKHPKLAARVIRLIKHGYKTSPIIGWAIDRRTPFLSPIAENLEIRRLWKRRFDEQFYTHLYWDVSPTGLSPILHYVRYGRVEQRIIRFKKDRQSSRKILRTRTRLGEEGLRP